MTTTWLASHFCLCMSSQFIQCPIICAEKTILSPIYPIFLCLFPFFFKYSHKQIKRINYNLDYSYPESEFKVICINFYTPHPSLIPYLNLIPLLHPFFRWIKFNFLAHSAFTFSCIFFNSLEHRSITFGDEASPSRLRFSVSSWFRRLCNCVVRSLIDLCTSPIITSIRFISASSCACSFAAVCSRRAKTPPAALPTPLRSSARLPARCSHAVADSAARAASSLSSVAEGGLEMKTTSETHSWGLAARREAPDRPNPSR